jgi:hypothetical protein
LVSPKTIFWEVDVQADFMLSGRSLYIPGAEKTNYRHSMNLCAKPRRLLVEEGWIAR